MCKYVPKQVNVHPIQDRNLVHQVINQPDLFLSIKISAKKEKKNRKIIEKINKKKQRTYHQNIIMLIMTRAINDHVSEIK